METGYEAFSFYYDQLTENVEYPQRAAYFHRLIQKYRQCDGVILQSGECPGILYSIESLSSIYHLRFFEQWIL